MSQRQFVAIGECMLELSHQSPIELALGFAGDTYNVSVYLARLQAQTQVDINYFTALGDDPYSEMMREAWQKEKLGTDLVLTLPGKMPGLYLIRTDPQGERSLYFYRTESAAKQMLENPQTEAALEKIAACDFIYFSAITCAILNKNSLDRLFNLLTLARSRDAKIIFDGNYRPRVWAPDSCAKKTVTRFLSLVDIALPTFEDEQELFGDKTPEECAARLLSLGVQEIVVKRGPEPALVASPTEQNYVAAEKVAKVLDTTGAGDSFNAGYLAARFAGKTAIEAAKQGHRLAAKVVTYPGCIIPMTAMEGVWLK